MSRDIKIVAGIDQSLNSTGIVILDAVSREVLESHAVVLNKNKKTPNLFGVARLVHIRNEVKRILEAHNVDFVVLEGYAYGSRGRSLFDLGEIGGAIRILAYDLGIQFETVPPPALKKYVTGKGTAEKSDMARVILEKYGHSFETSDEADAFSLAIMAIEVGTERIKEFCYKPKKPKSKKKKVTM